MQEIINKPEQIIDSSQILPSGILIFTDEMILDHKKEDGLKSKGDYCYWGTMKLPTRFVERLDIENAERVAYEDSFPYELITEFPIYFAIKGIVRGYFIINEIDSDKISNFWLKFHSESWVEIKRGEQLKPSQGWRYYPKPSSLRKQVK